MRITGGKLKGRIIKTPGSLAVRPTGSKVRQAFFNILGGRLSGARFLDLFAGSGVMGLEALSRGAGCVSFIDQSRKLTQTIESFLKTIDATAEVITGDARKVLIKLPPNSFDIIFADPPYNSRMAISCLMLVDQSSILNKNGILAIEHSKLISLPQLTKNLFVFDCRDYGQTTISFYSFQTN